MNSLIIGGSPIGNGHPVVICAEGGINANGDVEIAKRMIDVAITSKCNSIKWQKRTIDVVYSPEELSRPRDSVFGSTNGDLKHGLEFGREEYRELDEYCKLKDFTWWASGWDEASVDFLAEFDVPCFKIASACLTDDNLLKHHRSYHKPIILSTGMSTEMQVDRAVEVLGTDDLVLLHCSSVYPSDSHHLNLNCIPRMREKYQIPIGYSAHEKGLATTVAAVALGAVFVERHLTLDRTMWGSDQSSSVEPQGIFQMTRDIREIEKALGDGIKRIHPDEVAISKKLRRVDTARLEE